MVICVMRESDDDAEQTVLHFNIGIYAILPDSMAQKRCVLMDGMVNVGIAM